MALIDRDALIAKIRDDGILGNGYSDSEREDDVIDMIESCQTIDAKPVVHGKWKKIPVGFGFGYDYECTNCGYDPDENCTMFCPNCGAKMDGGLERP